MSDLLTVLENDIRQQLNASPFTAADDTPVTSIEAASQSQDDVLRRVESALESPGLSILVLTPDLQPLSGTLVRAIIGVRIVENVARNRRSGTPFVRGHEAAQQCWARLHEWTPTGGWDAVRISPEGLSQVAADDSTITWILQAYTDTHLVTA